MKALRNICWFLFFSLLWARIGVSLDRTLNDFWVALIVGGICAALLTGALICFAGAFLAERRLRRERLLALQRRMNEDTAEAQRVAQKAALWPGVSSTGGRHGFHSRREGSPTALRSNDAVSEFFNEWRQRVEKLA